MASWAAASPWINVVTVRARARWATRRPGSAAWSAGQRLDFIAAQEGEKLEVFHDVGVIGVDPELVESVGLVRFGSSQTAPPPFYQIWCRPIW